MYVDTTRGSRETRNLLENGEFVAHTASSDDTAILEGRADVVTDPAELRRFAPAYQGKYGRELRAGSRGETSNERVVFRLRRRVAFGWPERDFTRAAARWRFPCETAD